MIRPLLKILHLHWFQHAWASYTHAYEECRCSKRRARPLRNDDGFAPVALWWLEGRSAPHTYAGREMLPETRPRPMSMPVPGSGVRCAR